MARFYGEIGCGESVEKRPGVWEDVITVKKCIGDVLRDTRKLSNGESVNDNFTVGNSISIVATSDLLNKLHYMRYVKWMGTLWAIDSVDVLSPRLVLHLGGVYNGPTPEATTTI